MNTIRKFSARAAVLVGVLVGSVALGYGAMAALESDTATSEDVVRRAAREELPIVDAPSEERPVEAREIGRASDTRPPIEQDAHVGAVEPEWKQMSGDTDPADDVVAARAVAGAGVGDSCDSLSPALAEADESLLMRPYAPPTDNGVCVIAGWMYLDARRSPDLPKPDDQGFIAIPIYNDDGDVIDFLEPSDEARQSVAEFEAQPQRPLGAAG